MKASFYFVFWILIYPLLGLFHNAVLDQNSFIVALVLAFGLSWLLNRLMPATLGYERKLQVYPILSDVYEGNVAAFTKRVFKSTMVSIVTAVYFLLVTFAILFLSHQDIFALIIFGLLTFAYMSRSVSMYKTYLKIKENPTPEECMEIATETYRLNYAAYYEERMSAEGKITIPAPPRHFKIFQLCSLIFAALSAIFGLFFLLLFILSLLGSSSLIGAVFAGTSFLYGSLALYFGISDFISIWQEKKFIKKGRDEKA